MHAIHAKVTKISLFQILQILCQILQTEDEITAKSWLLTASETEKTLIFEMVKSAVQQGTTTQHQQTTETIEEVCRLTEEEDSTSTSSSHVHDIVGGGDSLRAYSPNYNVLLKVSSPITNGIGLCFYII